MKLGKKRNFTNVILLNLFIDNLPMKTIMEENGLLTGIGASPGIVIGKAMLVDQGRPDFSHVRLETEQDVGPVDLKTGYQHGYDQCRLGPVPEALKAFEDIDSLCHCLNPSCS